ncbi:MAG TPA: hypothetical protein VNO70_26505, partial [Blastocatellia bacterium]|nr:hypothetical protein [Blastocatellia bacterium]
MKRISAVQSLAVALCLTLTSSVMAYQDGSAQERDKGAPTDSRKVQSQVASGQKMKVQGVILKREGSSFTMRDTTAAELTVNLASTTKVEENKSNPFRR